jgi:hypothetical protein
MRYFHVQSRIDQCISKSVMFEYIVSVSLPHTHIGLRSQMLMSYGVLDKRLNATSSKTTLISHLATKDRRSGDCVGCSWCRSMSESFYTCQVLKDIRIRTYRDKHRT